MLKAASFPFSGRARLRGPAGLAARIRKARQAVCGIPREELSPSGVWIEDHALFLLEEAEALERQLKAAPRLPGNAGEARLARWTRAICREGSGEITAPLAVRVIRRETGEEEILRVFNVNLFGVYRVDRCAIPYLAQNARVIIVSSELAPLDPLPFTGIYAITKSALEKYAYSLRMELQLLGCGVVVVRPGAVKTGMLPDSAKALEKFCGDTKLYAVNAKRFRAIVEKVEARSVSPDRVAKKVARAASAKRPRLVYKLNRSPLLLAFNALPRRAQLFLIRKVLS